MLFGELERTLGGRLKHLPEGDRGAIRQMLESAVNKWLHAPTTKLRAHASEGGAPAGELAAAVRLLFDLPEVGAVRDAARSEGQDEDERLAH